MTARCSISASLYNDGAMGFPQYSVPAGTANTPGTAVIKPGGYITYSAFKPATAWNSQSFTWSLWAYRSIKTSEVSSPITFISAGNAPGTSGAYMSLRLTQSTEVLQFGFDNIAKVNTTSALSSDYMVWTHYLVSVTYVSASLSTAVLYRNGARQTMLTNRLATSAAPAPGAILTIGAARNAAVFSEFFAGYMDEIRLYSGQAYSDVEATAAYNNVFLSTNNMVLQLHFTTPDFLSISTQTYVSDSSNSNQMSGILGLAPSATAVPGPMLWTNNYTNPLCLPWPTNLDIAGSSCGPVNAPYTFYVDVRDWDNDVVTAFNGANVTARVTTTPAGVFSWYGATFSSGLSANATFVNGRAAFSVLLNTAQSLTFAFTDFQRIFRNVTTTTLTVSFTNSMYFTFYSIPAASVGTPASVVVALTACGGGIVTGVNVNVTLKASSGSPAQQTVTIDPSTGLGTATLTGVSASTATLSFLDTYGTGYNVSATSSIRYASSPAVFASKASATTVAVTSSVTLTVYTADLVGAQSPYSGQCNVLVTAKGSGSLKLSNHYVYLNGGTSPLNITLGKGVDSSAVTVQTHLAQTVSLTYISYCSNLTVTNTSLTVNSLSFTCEWRYVTDQR